MFSIIANSPLMRMLRPMRRWHRRPCRQRTSTLRAERLEDPADMSAAILPAKEATENGPAALLACITNEEQAFSPRRAFA